MSTKIEWTDETWNPVTGCTPISEGCVHCYAARMAKRLAGRCGYPEAPHEFDVTLHPDRLDQPLRWRKPRRVFVCSMGDLFHEDVPDRFILRVFQVMGKARQHTFQVLTKRPKRMMNFVSEWVVDPDGNPYPFPNIWLGVTAENQQRADQRVTRLLQIPAAVRFVSVEPMLGPIDISRWMTCCACGGTGGCDCVDCPACDGTGYDPQIDWIICGAETGPGARYMHPDWARALRDQCQAAGVSFFFKGWGGPQHAGWVDEQTRTLYQGRLLDGRTWDEYPEVAQ